MMSMRYVPTLMCKQKLPLLHISTGGGNWLQRPQPVKEKVVVVLGPTGAGKSRLSIDLATRFSAEVVNSDKMQVYKGLDVVTNKVTDEERCDVPHHLLGIFDRPDRNFTTTDFCSAASRILRSITARRHLPIIAGGSNSFVEALIDGGDEFAAFRSTYDVCFLWVDVAPRVLHAHLSARADKMVEMGMVEEARGMFDPRNADYTRGLRRAIGVGEFHRYFRTTTSDPAASARLLDDALDQVKSNTRLLACRQLAKIHRLRNVKGWRLHRLDATEVFRRRAAGGGGGEAAAEAEEMWEDLVVGPGETIVRRFLENFGPLIYADVASITPSTLGRAMAAATY